MDHLAENSGHTIRENGFIFILCLYCTMYIICLFDLPVSSVASVCPQSGAGDSSRVHSCQQWCPDRTGRGAEAAVQGGLGG